MLEKIVIADGGDMAVRIARACERLGIATAAACSESDARPLHAEACDEAVVLAGYDPRQMDEHAQALVSAAQAIGAGGVHPGSARLCSNARLAQAVEQAGLVWIGAPSAALASIADPLALRTWVADAGLRSPAGSDFAIETAEQAGELSSSLEYPLRIFTLAPGVEPVIVDSASDLVAQTQECLSAASRAGASPRVRLEAVLDQPRRLLVPVLVDRNREAVALSEREWTLEHRNHVLLEESPAPVLRSLHDGDHKRRLLMDGAAKIARDAGIVGSAAITFAIDASGRLHVTGIALGLVGAVGATEMCVGRDLAEAEIRIARGEGLSAELRSSATSGHAIEARVSSEATPHNPSLGPKPDAIRTLRFPPVVPGAMRIEPAIAANAVFAPEEEILIARVIAFGQTRHQAWLTLDRILAETTIEPVMSNLRLLRDVLADEAFRAGQYDVDSVERIIAQIKSPPQ